MSNCLNVYLSKRLINALDRKPHHVIVAAIQSCDPDIADPFLDAISTRLVEGLVVGDIIVDFFVGELLEGHVGRNSEASFLCGCEHTDSRGYLMRASADLTEHAAGIGLVDGLTQNLITHNHHRIGRNHQFVVGHRITIGSSLLACDILSHLRHREVGRIALVDTIQHPHLEGQS